VPTADVLREIRRATTHHGVATCADLRLSPHQLHGCVRAGALDRPHRGVYVDPARPRTPEQELAIAVAAGGHMAAAWGRSAAALWGLLDGHPSTPEIVVPHRRFAKVPGSVVRRSVGLVPAHVVRRDGIRCTDPLLTTIDAGVVLGPIEVAEIMIRGRQLKMFEPSAVAARLRDIARPGRTGVRTARAALDLVMIGDRPADSVLELRFAHGPGEHGIPPYEYQHPVTIEGRQLRIDFAYPVVMLAIEVDGYDSRRSRRSLDYDVDRQNLLTMAGWVVLRFTWTRIKNDPAGVAADIIATLGRLGHRFGS
jgi:hypothetical protein